MIASSLGIAIGTILVPVAQAETVNTNIDINTKSETFASTLLKNDPFSLDLNTLLVSPASVAPTQTLTPEEAAYQEKMVRWKAKQASLWKTLPREKFVINASAYTAAADECGKSDGITSSGVKVEENRTLACPPAFPFGAKIQIDGMGTYTCEDRGGAIKGNHFDIYMETKAEAFAFGRRNLEAQVIVE